MSQAPAAEQFDQWAIVELMGHGHIAGKVTEETRFGTVLMRVDVPAMGTDTAFTKYYNGASIYSISPCDEDTAMRYLHHYSPKPISIYVPQPKSDALAAIPAHIREDDEDLSRTGDHDWDGDYDDFDEDDSEDAEDTDDYDPQYNPEDESDPDFIIDESTLAPAHEDNALDILEVAFPDTEPSLEEKVAQLVEAAGASGTSVDEIILPDSSDSEHPHGMMPLTAADESRFIEGRGVVGDESPTADDPTPDEIPLSLYEDVEKTGEEKTLRLEDLIIAHVVRIQRKASKGSQSPMWEMETKEGIRLWVFDHKEPERNTWIYFRDAGYGDFLQNMKMGDVQRWQEWPIEITVFKQGEFYRPTLVTNRPVAAMPDTLTSYWPQRKMDVVNKAKALEKGVIVDVESTGTSPSDEITEIAFLNLATGEQFSTFVKPSDIGMVNIPSASGKKPTDINGITTEMLKDAPSIKDIAEQIYFWTENAILIGHQVEFDIRLINQSLNLAGLEEIKPKQSICTMHEMMDVFIGDPFGESERFRWQSLQDSAIYLGLTPEPAHRALNDCRTTLKIIKALAAFVPAKTADEDYMTITPQPF